MRTAGVSLPLLNPNNTQSMAKLIRSRKGRWFTSLFFFFVALMTLFFALSNRSGQVAAASPSSPIQRSAIYAPAAAGSFAFSPAQELVRPPVVAIPGGVVSLKDQDLEPEIKVDLVGNIYITAIHGVPGGVDLWKSINGGTSFVYLGEPDGAQDKCDLQPATTACTAGAGGGDDSIDVSTGGYLYVSSLYLGGVTMSTSMDGGMGGVAPGQAWTVHPASGGVPVNDREWVAAYGPQTLYMTFDQAPAPGPLWFVKSTDAGKTFSPPSMLVPAMGLSRENNLVVDQYNGNIYTTFTPAGSPNQINLLRSTDGGATWTTTTAYTGPAGTSVENSFPILAVDRGGNVHLAFTRSNGTTTRTNAHVFLMSSANQGVTWLPPVQVDSGVNTQSTVMPWIVAGSPGVVDVTWYGSSSASPDSAPFDWHVFFAQTTNALAPSPTFTQVLVTPTQVHNDAICSRGSGCAGSTRDLAEYYTMTVDPDGNANIAFVDGINDCVGPPTSNCYAKTWYAKQTSGPSAYVPPSAPGPATFAPNIAVTASGGFAEPNSKVDSHNCIFGGAIDGNSSRVFRSQNGGSSFTAMNLPLAPTSVGSGGDLDIFTLPKADGSRFDQLYAVDLDNGDFHVEAWKSTDGGTSYTQPGPGGSAGNVGSVSSDRMWLAGDLGVPTATDQTIYLMDHELASEDIRIAALTNDTAWSAFTSGTTDPELVLPPGSTLPNTNPGPVFVNKGGPFNHMIHAFFGASTVTTNTAAPPFGKMPNLWEAVGPPPAAAGAPPGPFLNHPVFKGVIDSPTTAPAGTTTYGNHLGLLFPWAAADSAGNVYAVWATNNSRANSVQTGTSTPSSTFDVWFAASHDGGQTFYGPWKVSSGTGTSLFPGMAAGDNGRIDISWYQTNAVGAPFVASGGTINGGPTTIPAGSDWNVMFAQSFNANSREPVFTVSQASDHPIHKGGICVNGLLCLLGGDRSLADFFQVSIGPDGLANIFSADNGVTSTHVNYMRQNSGPLAKANPTFPTCLPIPVPTSVVSRMVHATAGTFDINLPLPVGTGPRAVEPRSSASLGAGNYQLVFTFPNALTSVAGASVTSHNPASGTGSVSGAPVVSGNTCTVNLTNVSNAQYIQVTLTGVADNAGNAGNVLSPELGILIGDVNGNGVLTNADVSLVKAQVAAGGTVSASNFRDDVNANGVITNADVSVTKAQVAAGTQLPSTP
jgi:hypothetical protein